MKVPLLDLRRQYESIKSEINESIKKVIESQYFILGDELKELENKIADYCGTDYAIGVDSGTGALLMSMRALGIGKGDYVVTSPFTFFATAGAIWNAGAKPVFIDIKSDTYNIDPLELRKFLEGKSFHAMRMNIKPEKVRAIIPVHLYGQIADMDLLMEIADEYNLIIIEDACQAIGAEYKDLRAGSIGTTGCFSFFPTKNLGGYGDGGIITTNNEEVAECLKSLRVHGAYKGYHYSLIGFNSRLDTIQAAVLLAKLPYLDGWNDKRLENANVYNKSFKEIREISVPKIGDNRKHIFHQYTIRLKGNFRDGLKNFLEEKGIGTKVYYPLPLHLQKSFSFLGYKEGDCPVSEKASREVLSLPVFPELTREEMDFVIDSIKNYFSV